jgi:hypothetical protein
MRTSGLSALVVVFVTAMAGCAHTRFLAGTTIPATDDNLAIIETVERYRGYLVEKNVEMLLLLASQNYSEDGGTPEANDDYGYAKLCSPDGNRCRRITSASRVCANCLPPEPKLILAIAPDSGQDLSGG